MTYSIRLSRLGLIAVLALLLAAPAAFGQATCSDDGGQRICVVDPGFQTLNDAIDADTTAAGERNDPNTIYRLQRDGVYILNGRISNNGYPLVIEAEEGDGAPPLVQPGVRLDGSSDILFSAQGDFTLRGVYFKQMDDLGGTLSQGMHVNADSVRVVLEGNVFEFGTWLQVRVNGIDTRVFVRDHISRNVERLTANSNGRFLDFRSNPVDTLVIENSTFSMMTSVPARFGAPVDYLEFSHNTVFTTGNLFFGDERVIDLTFTNNLLVNADNRGEVHYADWEDCNGELDRDGDGEPDGLGGSTCDSLRTTYLALDTLNVPGLTEADRDHLVANNYFVNTPEFADYYASADTLSPTVLLNEFQEFFIADYPNFVYRDNVVEDFDPEFTNAPPVQPYLDWLIAFRTTPDATDFPGFAWMPNDNASELVNWPLPEDFSYPTDSPLYTAASGGFPVGDLNWFPEVKDQWVATPIENDGAVPGRFRLLGNYPNPFNPSTTIRFDLDAPAEVEIAIYDLVGRRVMALPVEHLPAGAAHELRVDAAGLSSGVYLYRVQARFGDQTTAHTGRMLLLK